MKTKTLTLLAALTLGATASSQVATATVRKGCTVQGPTNSLIAKPDAPITYQPNQDDLIVMECETVGPEAAWRIETDFAGYGGCAYLRWDGANHFNNPGNGTLTFRFQVNTPGDYLMRMHVRHDNPDRSQENDCWVRMDGGAWDKHFNNFQGSVGVWNWDSVLESTNAKPIYNLTAGVHEFQVSGRSWGFKIDKISFFPQTTFGTDPNFPESERPSDRPIIGQQFSVEIDDHCGEGGTVPGSSLVQWLANPNSAGFVPCGVVFKGNEILINLGAPKPTKANPLTVWNGDPITVTVDIPNDVSIVGWNVYTQAVFVNPGSFTTTDALDLVIGTM